MKPNAAITESILAAVLLCTCSGAVGSNIHLSIPDRWGYPDSVVATVNPGQHPRDLCSLPSGEQVYVAVGFGLVTVIDTSDNSISGVISAGNSPRGICSLPSGEFVYVTDDEDHTVTVIKTADNSIVTVIDVSGSPWGICSTPDGEHVYVTHTGGFVTVIQTSDNVVVESMSAGNYLRGICTVPSGEYVYVSDGCSPKETMIRTSDYSITRFFSGMDTCDFESSLTGDYVYATVPGWNMVVEFLTLDNSITSEITDVGTDPRRLVVLPGQGYLYVTSQDDDIVFVLDPSSSSIIDSIAVGVEPDGICSLPSGDFLYVACDGSNSVNVLGHSETGIPHAGNTEGTISVRLFPNPCTGSVTASFTSPPLTPLTVSVYDISGRLIARPLDGQLPSGSNTLWLEELPPGVLTVVVSSQGIASSERLVVLR